MVRLTAVRIVVCRTFVNRIVIHAVFRLAVTKTDRDVGAGKCICGSIVVFGITEVSVCATGERKVTAGDQTGKLQAVRLTVGGTDQSGHCGAAGPMGRVGPFVVITGVVVIRIEVDRLPDVQKIVVLSGLSKPVIYLLLFHVGTEENENSAGKRGSPGTLVCDRIGECSVSSVSKRGRRERSVRIKVIVTRQHDLLHVVRAFHAAGGFPRGLNGGEKQTDQDPDNRDHDQKFNKREPLLSLKVDHHKLLSNLGMKNDIKLAAPEISRSGVNYLREITEPRQHPAESVPTTSL